MMHGTQHTQSSCGSSYGDHKFNNIAAADIHHEFVGKVVCALSIGVEAVWLTRFRLNQSFCWPILACNIASVIYIIRCYACT